MNGTILNDGTESDFDIHNSEFDIDLKFRI